MRHRVSRGVVATVHYPVFRIHTEDDRIHDESRFMHLRSWMKIAEILFLPNVSESDSRLRSSQRDCRSVYRRYRHYVFFSGVLATDRIKFRRSSSSVELVPCFSGVLDGKEYKIGSRRTTRCTSRPTMISSTSTTRRTWAMPTTTTPADCSSSGSVSISPALKVRGCWFVRRPGTEASHPASDRFPECSLAALGTSSDR